MFPFSPLRSSVEVTPSSSTYVSALVVSLNAIVVSVSRSVTSMVVVTPSSFVYVNV